MAAAVVYDKYSVNAVFQQKFFNIICNQLMQGLLDENFDNFNDHFALSGDAADCYNTNSSGPIEQIIFKTDERDILIFISKNLPAICPSIKRMETYENRIVSYFDGVFIEFHLENSITTSPNKGIYTTT